jgi:glycerophosphoryl diester phosphodiesterase
MLKYDILDKTIVGTFEGHVTEYIDSKYPEVTRSARISEVLQYYIAFLYGNVAIEFDFDVLQIPQGLKGFYDFGSKNCIDYAHSKGIAVQFWTINKAKDVARLVANGADAIITDNPKMAYDVIHGDN